MRESKFIRKSTLALAFALGLSTGSLALAQEQLVVNPGFPQVPQNPQIINNAVGLYLTPKGEESLSRNLEQILENTGFSLNTGYFSEVKFKSDKSISLEALAKSSPQAGQMIQTLRQILSEWFVGLTINDPQPSVTMRKAGYRMALKSLRLSTDRAALASLGRKTGAVLAFDAEVDHLDVGADSVVMTDLKNDFLGPIGIMQPVLSLQPGSQNLKLHIPIFVDVSPSGVSFEVLSVASNFTETNLEMRNGALIIPDVNIEVNGRKFPLNKEHLVKTFEEMKPKLLVQLKGTLDEALHQSFVKAANDAIKAKIPSSLGQVAQLKPPGAPKGAPKGSTAPGPDFVWGMNVKRIGMGTNVLAVELDSYVEDPSRKTVPLGAKSGARGPVTLAGADPKLFDLALTVNRSLINRVLQLSTNRGLFSEVEAKPGQMLEVLRPPVLDSYKPTAGRDSMTPQLTMNVSLASPAQGCLQKIMLNGKVKFTVDVVAHFVSGIPGAKGLRVQLDDFDMDSVYVWPESLSPLGSLFHDQVVNGVKDELRKAAAGWKAKPNIVNGDFPLPPELFGQQLNIQTMRLDKNGYIVMFLNFQGAN